MAEKIINILQSTSKYSKYILYCDVIKFTIHLSKKVDYHISVIGRHAVEISNASKHKHILSESHTILT